MDAFLRAMAAAGFEVKQGRGGVISFRAEGQERFTRLRSSTLGKGYGQEDIQTIIEGRTALPQGRSKPILAAADEQALTEKLFQALLHEEHDVVKSRARKLSALRQKLEMVRQKIVKLYDEKFEKGMDEEIFKTMSARYEGEKSSLEAEISVSEAEASKTRSKEDNIRFWTAAVKQAITIDGLTRDVLGTLVDHIVVHEREEVDGETRQRVEIYYKFVGKLSDMPEKLDAAG